MESRINKPKESNLGKIMKLNRECDDFVGFSNIESLFAFGENLLSLDFTDYIDPEFIKPFFVHLLDTFSKVIEKLQNEKISFLKFSLKKQRENLLEKLKAKKGELEKVLINVSQEIDTQKNKIKIKERSAYVVPNHPGTNTLH